MPTLSWYWHRLQAMGPGEIARRFKKKTFEMVDARRNRDWMSVQLKSGSTYPVLPNSKNAPESLHGTLKRDMEEILAGRWRAFGCLPIEVTDPPQWHKDHLVGVDLPTRAGAFGLEYRTLPHSADIKLIWELSRWHPLSRLAMAAYVLGESKAARKCLHWLEHWAQHNPPYHGWNWTSALEAGIRLVQFAWIEALLEPFVRQGEGGTEAEQLRYELLPSHAWFIWRHRSFGSSANNHLLGELAGLIVAVARWPELARWAVTLDELQPIWEREVLAQFAEDGGNREQALTYHLFSFEFCWHTRAALIAAGRKVAPAVEERLSRAVEFFVKAHGKCESWNYGDSDDGFVMPLFSNPTKREEEWINWMTARENCQSISYWIGDSPALPNSRVFDQQSWHVYPDSGIAVAQNGEMFLRFDASPLGYLATAAHGHLDALHLSIWINGVAMIVDPGTGAYYSSSELRDWLSSERAHNAPQSNLLPRPRRLGAFLWSDRHPKPSISNDRKGVIAGELSDGLRIVKRSADISDRNRVIVVDSVRSDDTRPCFTVLWQFAPGAVCHHVESRKFRVTRERAGLEIAVSSEWETVKLVTKPSPDEGRIMEGTVSPHFRVVTWAPYLKLTARSADQGCRFTTTFSVVGENSKGSCLSEGG